MTDSEDFLQYHDTPMVHFFWKCVGGYKYQLCEKISDKVWANYQPLPMFKEYNNLCT